jgi:ribonuclease HI
MYLIQFDGASRGNPGKATSAALLYDDTGKYIDSLSYAHESVMTNNQAEYIGCLLGVKLAQKYCVSCIHIQGDSQLVMYQLQGKYTCKNETLKTYYEEIRERLKSFEKVEYSWIPREKNEEANALCNKAFK